MMNKERQKRSRIPVRFVDDEKNAAPPASESEPTPDEIGRESSYEDETEVQRRVDRGVEEEAGDERGDDADVAGGPDPSELPERREDQDTNPTHGEGQEPAREAAGAARADLGGPQLAELLATRAELKRVEGELKKLTDERQEMLDNLRRRQADFDNYRKRIERERAETYSRVVGEVVSRLLPVIDNLGRALDAESTFQASESEEFRHFLHGVELINQQLNGVLENLNVKPVPTVGQPFDPHVHEAVATEETEEYQPDTVTAELVRGYRLGDTLIRPAMVKVAK